MSKLALGKQADQGPVEGEAELTPIQRWFFERNFTDKHHWNQSVMLHAKDGFDPDLVGKTLQALIEHHDALRAERIMVFNQCLQGFSHQVRIKAVFRVKHDGLIPVVFVGKVSFKEPALDRR